MNLQGAYTELRAVPREHLGKFTSSYGVIWPDIGQLRNLGSGKRPSEPTEYSMYILWLRVQENESGD
ncbi:hypothetical protein [uncultured Planktomarina sp.]|uniref:hypothetical protein n=1 Tax=uncultured Planktomarina sp. TaxID=1538529 RepID=UPI003260533F